MSTGLHALAGDGLLSQVRGIAGVWAGRLAEGTTVERTLAIGETMLDNGVIARPIGDSIAFCPPLTISDSDIDTCIDVLADAIGKHPLP